MRCWRTRWVSKTRHQHLTHGPHALVRDLRRYIDSSAGERSLRKRATELLPQFVASDRAAEGVHWPARCWPAFEQPIEFRAL